MVSGLMFYSKLFLLLKQHENNFSHDKAIKLKSGNIWNLAFLKVRFSFGYSYSPNHLKTGSFKNGHFCLNFKCFLTKGRPFKWISNGWASWFQIPFKIPTICNPTSFWPFKIQTSLGFRSPLCLFSLSSNETCLVKKHEKNISKIWICWIVPVWHHWTDSSKEHQRPRWSTPLAGWGKSENIPTPEVSSLARSGLLATDESFSRTRWSRPERLGRRRTWGTTRPWWNLHSGGWQSAKHRPKTQLK